MKLKRGSTSVRRLIFIADSSSTVGAGLANLAYNTASLVAYYFAGDLSNEVQITLATATLGTWTSGGFVAVDNTNMPGWYEIGIPNAALDGGNECALQFRGATNMVPVNVYVELDTVDYQTAAFGAMPVYTQPTGFLAASFPSDPADQSLVIDATNTILGRLPAALESGRIAAVLDSATAGKIDQMQDGLAWLLTERVGAVANPQNAAALCQLTIWGSDYSIQFADLTETGVRGTTTLEKA